MTRVSTGLHNLAHLRKSEPDRRWWCACHLAVPQAAPIYYDMSPTLGGGAVIHQVRIQVSKVDPTEVMACLCAVALLQGTPIQDSQFEAGEAIVPFTYPGLSCYWSPIGEEINEVWDLRYQVKGANLRVATRVQALSLSGCNFRIGVLYSEI